VLAGLGMSQVGLHAATTKHIHTIVEGPSPEGYFSDTLFGMTSPLAVCLYFALEAVGDSQIGKLDRVEELTP